MKKEFDIREIWQPYEIHPETPLNGVLLSERFPNVNLEEFFYDLNARGKAFDARFGQITLLSNSGAALEASEFAKDQGRFHELHDALFRAYFTEARDIGDKEVLYAAASEVGLDITAMEDALKAGRYRSHLESATARGRKLGVSAVPAFVINDVHVMTGAQPLETFRRTLTRIATECEPDFPTIL